MLFFWPQDHAHSFCPIFFFAVCFWALPMTLWRKIRLVIFFIFINESPVKWQYYFKKIQKIFGKKFWNKFSKIPFY